ncbi:hypothetical protein NC652_025563 [Populus alba x Populus x berolinensis]|nr:hypothetical protein NC652_025563 [Populus alba x Populus x berolinensis]
MVALAGKSKTNMAHLLARWNMRKVEIQKRKKIRGIHAHLSLSYSLLLPFFLSKCPLFHSPSQINSSFLLSSPPHKHSTPPPPSLTQHAHLLGSIFSFLNTLDISASKDTCRQIKGSLISDRPNNLAGNHTYDIMSHQSTFNPSKTLEGVHGIHVVPHSPFALKEINQQGDFPQSTCESSGNGLNQLLLMQRVWQQRPGCLRPIQGCIHGDQHLAETVANVITSLPFIALGIQAPRKNLNTKLYANSLIGVGVASSLYHSSRGKLRKYLRWFDYTMIATATVCLSRALRNENPKFLMAASAALLPIQPLMVSAIHTGMMEVAFAKRALKDPDLRMAHNLHKMSSLLGGVLFIADDCFPTTPFLHAGWHLAAAIGVGTCNKLLK